MIQYMRAISVSLFLLLATTASASDQASKQSLFVSMFKSACIDAAFDPNEVQKFWNNDQATQGRMLVQSVIQPRTGAKIESYYLTFLKNGAHFTFSANRPELSKNLEYCALNLDFEDIKPAIVLLENKFGLKGRLELSRNSQRDLLTFLRDHPNEIAMRIHEEVKWERSDFQGLEFRAGFDFVQQTGAGQILVSVRPQK
jgi:hypothetical protein